MSNNFIADFLTKANDRFSIDAVNMPMSEWIMRNTSLKKLPFSFKNYEFQRQIVDDMHPDLNVIKISQVGLALDLNTKIPTPSGWTTMGETTVGDKLYDEQGNICTITYTSPIYIDRKCYEVEFDNGDKIVADEHHKWFVESERMFNPESGLFNGSGRIPKGVEYKKEGVITTKLAYEIYKKGPRNILSIPNTKPLKGNNKKIPIDPYYLGLWLGDGHSYSTRITTGREDSKNIINILEHKGFKCTDVSNKDTVKEIKVDYKNEPNGQTLYNKLLKCNLLKNKHIPSKYLRANKNIRLELLQGLMDSDGTITKGSRCSFSNTSPQLVEDFIDLVNSLGLKTRTRWRLPNGKTSVLKSGHIIKSKLPIAEVSFITYSDFPVFKLPRKSLRLRNHKDSKPTKTFRRHIVSIKEVETRPVKCITVDSRNHLFLAGEGMIPTHNTEVQIRKALGFLVRNRGTSLIFSLPNEDMFERVSKARVKPIVNADKVFNTSEDSANKSVRSTEIMQFGQSFLYLVPALESAATSIAADFVMNDEVDLSDQKMISLFNSRLQGSKYKLSQKFSTPSFPSYGIDLNWQTSDQHLYMCRCSSCGHQNHPEFNRNFIHIPGLPDIESLTDLTVEFQDDIELHNSYVMCEKCHMPLDLGNPDMREWVAMYPNRTATRGYRISPFVTDNLSVQYIIKSLWEYQKNEYVRGFYNTVLGLPYSDGNMQIPIQAIHDCMTEDTMAPDLAHVSGDLWIGIDVGQTCHVTIGVGPNKDNINIISIYSVKIDEIVSHCKTLCERYNVRGGCIDRHPYEPTSREIFNVTKGIIVPVEYRGSKDIHIVENEYKEITHAQVNRTSFLDNLATRIRKRACKISGYGYHKQVFIEHLRDMVREETPEKEAKWIKLNGNDHFFHSTAFMLIAPAVRELIGLHSKADVRTLTLAQSFIIGDNTPNLVGVSKKRLDSPLLGG